MGTLEIQIHSICITADVRYLRRATAIRVSQPPSTSQVLKDIEEDLWKFSKSPISKDVQTATIVVFKNSDVSYQFISYESRLLCLGTLSRVF